MNYRQRFDLKAAVDVINQAIDIQELEASKKNNRDTKQAYHTGPGQSKHGFFKASNAMPAQKESVPQLTTTVAKKP